MSVLFGEASKGRGITGIKSGVHRASNSQKTMAAAKGFTENSQDFKRRRDDRAANPIKAALIESDLTLATCFITRSRNSFPLR